MNLRDLQEIIETAEMVGEQTALQFYRLLLASQQSR